MSPEQAARAEALERASKVLASRPPAKGPFTQTGQQAPEVGDLVTAAEYIVGGASHAVVFRRAWDQDVLFEGGGDES